MFKARSSVFFIFFKKNKKDLKENNYQRHESKQNNFFLSHWKKDSREMKRTYKI